MFFNGKKLTERKPKESRKFEFTDNFCRKYEMEDWRDGTILTDSLCKNLTMYISQYGNHTYSFTSSKGSKAIGSVHTVTVKEAREIVHNIQANLDEFLGELKSIKIPLVFYFRKYGMYPHKKVEEVHHESYENVIKKLREDNESLNTANECLRAQIKYLQGKLFKIQDVAKFTETPAEVKDD